MSFQNSLSIFKYPWDVRGSSSSWNVLSLLCVDLQGDHKRRKSSRDVSPLDSVLWLVIPVSMVSSHPIRAVNMEGWHFGYSSCYLGQSQHKIERADILASLYCSSSQDLLVTPKWQICERREEWGGEIDVIFEKHFF